MKRLHRYLSQTLTLLPLATKLWEWSSLNAMLGNSTARVIYALPVAGYIILYSDYFQPLFRSAVLSSTWGFPFSFLTRIHMIYYGSLVLLIAFGLYRLFSPPLLRNKRDFQQFASDIIIARDRATVQRIVPPTVAYLLGLPVNPVNEETSHIFSRMQNAPSRIGTNAGEYEVDIPHILTWYYNWQNKRLARLRVFIFCVAIFGYGLLTIPSFDLFLRVLGTSLK